MQEEGQDIPFEDAKDPSNGVYSDLTPQALDLSLPYPMRRSLIELHCLRKRCEEERVLVKDEMRRLVSFYTDQRALIASHLDLVANGAVSAYSLGLRNLLLSMMADYHQHLLFLKKIWGGIVDVKVHDACPSFAELTGTNIVPVPRVLEDDYDIEDIELTDDDDDDDDTDTDTDDDDDEYPLED